MLQYSKDYHYNQLIVDVREFYDIIWYKWKGASWAELSWRFCYEIFRYLLYILMNNEDHSSQTYFLKVPQEYWKYLMSFNVTSF